jgi:predicted Zn-dependent peptidase
MTTHRRGAVLVLAALPATAQGFKDLENKVVEKTLPNGLQVLILPRPEAPVVSFVT